MSMRSKQVQFWLLVVVLVACGGLIHAWERAGEARIERRELKEFPARLGQWQQSGADVRFSAATEDILRASDYVLRSYATPDGRSASVYIGYYTTQRAGAVYHSPLNCMPGSGWTLRDHELVRVEPADGSPAFEANRYVIQNASERHALVYWYQGRGRATANEYRDKLYTVWDSIGRRRSDGAMVRVIVPVRGADEAESLKLATELAGQVAPELPRFVPN